MLLIHSMCTLGGNNQIKHLVNDVTPRAVEEGELSVVGVVVLSGWSSLLFIKNIADMLA